MSTAGTGDLVDDDSTDEDDDEAVEAGAPGPWSPVVCRIARGLQALVILVALVAIGLGVAGRGPFASLDIVTRWIAPDETLAPASVPTTAPIVTSPPSSAPLPPPTVPPTVPATAAPPLFDPVNGVYGAMPVTPKPDVAEGASGDAVYYLQAVLGQRAGHADLALTGTFGPETTVAVIQLQAFFGLPQTGVVDAATWPSIDLLATQ